MLLSKQENKVST